MTPYYWKTPRSGAERLAALTALDVTSAFDIHVSRRTDPQQSRETPDILRSLTAFWFCDYRMDKNHATAYLAGE